MKIKEIVLENFRSYRERVSIPFAQLTGFIGQNDAGKSNILEALDIFFEGGTIKIEKADGSVGGAPQEVRIGVVFCDIPEQLTLDSNALTTLQAEHLLNADGYLEIHKIFNCQNQTPKAVVKAMANHPTADIAADVLQKNQRGLRELIQQRGLENNCNQAENPSMRQAIYQSIGDLQLQLREVSLNDDNGKAIWSALQKYLPIFAFFQSDRPSSDQDPEVQNPMKLAIEKALDDLGPKLDEITAEVQKQAQETAQRTLDKLRETYPDIASTLEPKFKKPPWKSVFKLDLEADEGIPLNKRGSGVRRLVLLSFFQAEAEKKRQDANAGDGYQRKVVYAVEEPETSQHPDNQEAIITALRGLADAGDQVVLTTHVPALAALFPLEGLRYVDRDPDSGSGRVRSGSDDENVFAEIADALGVLPDPLADKSVSVAVLVEGKTDIDALRSMVEVLSSAGEIDGFAEDRVFWTIGGGDNTLMDWVERKYLDRLNIPQVMIQDSDRTSNALPVAQKKTDWLNAMNARAGVTAFLTQKRSMDNYLHPDALTRVTGGLVALPNGTDLNFVAMASELSNHLTAARNNAANTGFNYQPTEHDGTLISGTSKGACKKIICAHLVRNMTVAELDQRSSYLANGVQRNEVREWIAAILEHL
ncbi:ATP-binding protein [uncultured Tateyamaria sp.]|uniref:ATP-binding protein n=1 Tax=uncultured Tateyamaria sp. TaxID=455651 RepID=UPI0026310BC8|nr:ATP-binding protein [uncultured Tateyamaria sp.]